MHRSQPMAPDKEGWYTHPETGRKVLLLMGEEVHDDQRSPQANHYLCLGVDREMRRYAARPQALINAVDQSGGAGFLAHPIERAAPLFDEPEIACLDWEVNDLGSDRKVVAIGGADAHANVYSLGPLKRRVLPYEYLFRAVNAHLLLDAPLSSNFISAKAQVLDALRAGHGFVAYDLAGSSRGFRFTAIGREGSVSMGDEIQLKSHITLHVTSPLPADLRLLKNGQEVARARGQGLTYEAKQLGVYRVEAYRHFRFRRRGWVFSNPIYVRG